MKRLLIGLALLHYVVAGCGPDPDNIGALDAKAWRNDRGGCRGVRQRLLADFKAVHPELKGKTSNEIGRLLGRPDANQLLDRNQKYYVYYLQNGPQCQPATTSGTRPQAPSVALRMSAMGVVTEITYQNGLP